VRGDKKGVSRGVLGVSGGRGVIMSALGVIRNKKGSATLATLLGIEKLGRIRMGRCGGVDLVGVLSSALPSGFATFSCNQILAEKKRATCPA
jgi:hypothetical protein